MKETALLLLNLQNDFLRPDGAAARGKQHILHTRTLTERLIRVTEHFRTTDRGTLISCQFTLVADADLHPLLPDNVARDFPFLGRGDFHRERRGHRLISELVPVDYAVDTIDYSAFYRTHLDWMLKKLDVEKLVIAGLPAHTAVLHTVKDALLNDYEVSVLSDGCADFTEDAMRESLRELRHLCSVMTCEEYRGEVNPVG